MRSWPPRIPGTWGELQIPPVTMWKLGFLRFHHHLSDRGVMARAQTDVAFLWNVATYVPVPA
jgi:hypothetical protein